MNGINIILSKHNGFFQVFDLYMFPMYEPTTETNYQLDYYLDFALDNTTQSGSRPHSSDKVNHIFKRVDYYNPRMLEMQNYEVGDAFESHREDYRARRTIFTVTGKRIVAPYETEYTVLAKESNWPLSNLDPIPGIDTTFTNTFTVTDTARLMPDNLMPEEAPNKTVYWYINNDTTHCFTSNYYATDNIQVGYVYFEPRGDYYEYKMGMNVLTSTEIIGVGMKWTSEMTYSKKNGVSCGIPANIATVAGQQNTIVVYPNPVVDRLNISVKDKSGPYVIQLIDQLGSTISKAIIDANETISVSDLANGLYLLQIRDDAGNSMNKKIVVQH